MSVRPALITGLILAALSAQASACGTLRTYAFNVTDRTTGLEIVVGHVDTRKQSPVSFASSLTVDANILADLSASVAAGCTQSVTQTSYGSNWAWNNAAGGYDVAVTLDALRPSLGVSRRIKSWQDISAVGPYPAGGDGAEQPVHVHTQVLSRAVLRRLLVGDQLQVNGGGFVWAEPYFNSVFDQAYGSYSWGAAFETPLLQIYLP
jgi:hypothetical protein